MASLGGRTAPGDTLQGVTPEWKHCGQIYRKIVEKRGRAGKKVRGDTVQEGDTRVKSIKSDSDEQKRSSVFQEKINRGDTAELAETVMTKKGRQFLRKK